MADRCRRTLSIVERALDGRTTEDDREHAPTCEACTNALARLPTFEYKLAGAARSLAAESLPASLLSIPSGGGTVPGVTGRSVRGLALIAAAALGLVIIALGVREVGRFEGGTGGSAASMRSQPALVGAMATLGLSCRETILGPAASPPLRGSLCTPVVPHSGVEVAGAIELDPAGTPAAVLIKTRVSSAAGEAGRKRVDDLVVDLAGAAFVDPADAEAAEAWVRAALPTATVVPQTTSIGGLDVSVEVPFADAYIVHVEVPKQ